MTDNPTSVSTSPEVAQGESQTAARREWPLFVGAFVLYALFAFAIVLSPNWTLWRQALFTKGGPPAAQDTLKLTLIHTNDTWGYLEPCG